jgi:hypothetical protein
MKRLLAAAGALALLATAGPALAAPAKHGACKAPKDAVVLKAGAKPVEAVIPTPVGVGNLTGETPVGTYYLDLAGKPADSRGKVTFTLSWANPISDYDLVVNGNNALSTDNPEVASLKASHCRPIKLGIDVFIGLPIDEITLSAKGA